MFKQEKNEPNSAKKIKKIHTNVCECVEYKMGSLLETIRYGQK